MPRLPRHWAAAICHLPQKIQRRTPPARLTTLRAPPARVATNDLDNAPPSRAPPPHTSPISPFSLHALLRIMTASSTRPQTRRRLLALAGIVFLLLALVYGLWWWL